MPLGTEAVYCKSCTAHCPCNPPPPQEPPRAPKIPSPSQAPKW